MSPQHNHLLCAGCLGRVIRRADLKQTPMSYLCERRDLPVVDYSFCCCCGRDLDALRPASGPPGKIAFRQKADVEWDGFGEQSEREIADDGGER